MATSLRLWRALTLRSPTMRWRALPLAEIKPFHSTPICRVRIPREFFLAPHTSGPRDVPRCGALSLLQKDAALQGGDSAEIAARLNVKLRTSVTGDWCVTGACFFTPSRAFAVVALCFCTSLLAARCPSRVARSPRPCPRPRHDRTCLIRCSLLSFLISAATAGG